MKLRIRIIGLLSVLLTACATTVGATDPSNTSPNAVDTCKAQCEGLGLEFDAVAINKRDVGCICEEDD